MMNTMMNYDNAMTDNENFAIQIVVDNEKNQRFGKRFPCKLYGTKE